MGRTRRLELSPLVASDMEEIADYIGRDDPIRAASFVAELEAKCRAVAEAPERYPARPDLVPGAPPVAPKGQITCRLQ
jgi:toxin ParE1/3/4